MTTARSVSEFSTGLRSDRPSVAIVGAGVVGLGIGWRLAAAGCRVEIFDKGEAGRGASHAAAGMLASYQRGHRLASRPLYEATNAIASLYTDDRRPARLLRAAGLRLAQGVAPFRQLIASHLTQRVA